MPRLWSDTIEAHRRTVRDATIDATAGLVARHGLRGVTMSQVAEATGIGRATLYKYFPDVESILATWHEREIAGHLQQLAEAREQAESPAARLKAVLVRYASIIQDSDGHHDPELASLLHRDERVARAEEHLRSMVRELLADTIAAGDVRGDIPVDELANYCLNAIAGARRLRSMGAVRRLVDLTLTGLRPQTGPARLSPA